LVHFSGFGIVHQEKSGNPDAHTKIWALRNDVEVQVAESQNVEEMLKM
jgi:hypothetical protein